MNVAEAAEAEAPTPITDIMADTAYAAVREMAALQDRLNTVVHPQWRAQGHPYYRAIWVECAELLDHYGWKWWKNPQRNIDQVKMEIVDIWHFGLSELIRDDRVNRFLARVLLSSGEDVATPHFQDAVEIYAAAVLSRKRFQVGKFVHLMRSLPMTFDELYRLYIGKNVLNEFRQQHGYKDGTYRKFWFDGREDNEHLSDVLREADIADPAALPGLIAKELAALYIRAA